MAVPKKRKTSAQAGQKRSHDDLAKTQLGKCPQCGEAVMPHNACTFCGYYNNNKVVNIETKLDKKLKKEAKNESSK